MKNLPSYSNGGRVKNPQTNNTFFAADDLDPDSYFAIFELKPGEISKPLEIQLPDGMEITIRPIRPEDAEMEKDFVARMSDESKYYRFMDTIRELTQPMLVRFTQIDYDREMALVATVENEDGTEKQIGVSRYVTNPDGESVEFALAVADDWQKHGIGRKLMGALIECARMKGYRAVVGDVLALNTKMFRLMTSLGFTIHPHPDDAAVKRVVKPLQG